MTKYGAFGATLAVGVQQVETATVALDGATITTSGNVSVTVTCTGMTGSPLALSVAVLNGDDVNTVAQKIRTALGLNANVTALFKVEGSGAQVVLRKKVPAANIANLNIALADDTSDGVTSAASSANTVTGVANANIAQIKSIGGPGLALDTEDVTTHDSPNAWEEVIATILRSGELSLDLVYDPGGATHDASTGLAHYLEDRTYVYFDLTFLSTYNWTFEGYVTGFEPDAPHDGSLSASATIKISSAPTLE